MYHWSRNVSLTKSTFQTVAFLIVVAYVIGLTEKEWTFEYAKISLNSQSNFIKVCKKIYMTYLLD